MKEKIYTIPVNEVYETDCECPLCELESRLEREAIEYELGAAMMEADHREESNNKGFCNRHFEQMFYSDNKLSLALVLDTHLDEIRKRIDALEKTVNSSKSGVFKKSNAGEELTDALDNIEKTCMVCEKIDYTMTRYIDVLLYLWATEEEFREKFENSKGVCLKHMKKLIKNVPKSLKGKDADAFLKALYQKQKRELDRIQEDIHKFTLKFDYRFKDMEWGTAHDAPIRTIEKISGYIQKNNKSE